MRRLYVACAKIAGKLTALLPLAGILSSSMPCRVVKRPTPPIAKAVFVNLLHIIATPRGGKSNTLPVSAAFLEHMCARYGDLRVQEIDLFTSDLPAVVGVNIESKYTLMAGRPIDKHHQESWKEIERQIQLFLAADLYLISTPMWNFSIPYPLKYYIDAIVQPGYLFKYNERGQAVGLVTGKKMVCITSRGGDYGPHSPLHSYDLLEPYLRTIFGFVGITDICFVNVQPMDVSHELRQSALAAGMAEARHLATAGQWEVEQRPDTENPPRLKPAPLP
jgi:FMN-dependent NADH-azoreductase